MTRRTWGVVCRALMWSAIGLDIAAIGFLIDSRLGWFAVPAGFVFTFSAVMGMTRRRFGLDALIVGPVVAICAVAIMLNAVALMAPVMPLGLFGALTIATLLTTALALWLDGPSKNDHPCALEGSSLGDLQWRHEN